MVTLWLLNHGYLTYISMVFNILHYVIATFNNPVTMADLMRFNGTTIQSGDSCRVMPQIVGLYAIHLPICPSVYLSIYLAINTWGGSLRFILFVTSLVSWSPGLSYTGRTSRLHLPSAGSAWLWRAWATLQVSLLCGPGSRCPMVLMCPLPLPLS